MLPVLHGHAQFYQGSQNEFGKNRIQYRDFLWQQYRFNAFDVYFYEGGKQLATFTSRVAEKNIKELEKLFDNSFQDKVQFIVYNTHSDFKQSNIGITGDEQYNIGGATRLVGSKVFVYFEGDYVALEKQIRDGLAHVIVNQLLYGGNWREVIKNSTLLNLPSWFVDGLIMYAGNDIDYRVQSTIRSGILSGRFEKFNRLEDRESVVAGYALWNYIGEVYGENVIPNILYMARVTRNVESGFLYVLGISMETINKEFLAFYRGKYVAAQANRDSIRLEEIPVKTKKDRVYTQFEISPDGQQAVFVSNIMGQYRIYLLDLTTGKRKKIIKREHKLNRITDYSYPIIAWHPSGKAFAFANEWRGKLWLNTYSIEEDELNTREIFVLDKILSLAYSPDGQNMVFSGVDNGQTDIYLYYLIGNRQEKLTDDLFDDFSPAFSPDGHKIIFTSNRIDDTLRVNPPRNFISKNRDVFAYNLKTRSKILERITNTPDLNELQPAVYDSVRYTFLAELDEITNRYVATYDSAITAVDTTIHYRYFTTAVPLTNYQVDLLNYQTHPRSKTYSLITYEQDGYHFYRGNFRNDDLDRYANLVQEATGEDTATAREELPPVPDNLEEPVKIYPNRDKVPQEVDVENYVFEGEKDFTYTRETIAVRELPEKKKVLASLPAGVERKNLILLDSLALPGARNYNLNFTTDYVLTQLDNSFGTTFYQPLSGPDNLNPGVSGLVKMGISDLFEDYKITGGFRLSFGLDNSAYMLSFEDLSKRLDKRMQVYRQANRYSTSNGGIIKAITYSGGYRLSWPLNEVFSIRGTALYRHDRYIQLALDVNSLSDPIVTDNWAGLKGELVFDNVLYKGLNLYNGMRWKIWAETYRHPLEAETDLTVLGLDFRHYQKIHRQLIWANRLALSTSLGKERLAYFLGGVDNWLWTKTDGSLPLAPSQNFVYQALASPMRGFFYNSRNGNSFGVINSEIRWPIFSYLLNRPIRSDFIQNFQIVGFFDVGSAWTGLHPYSEENAFNEQVVRAGNLTVTVENNQDPIVYGYGWGLRSRLLGYFVRVDWAWGVDDGVVLPSVFYVSLALDF